MRESASHEQTRKVLHYDATGTTPRTMRRCHTDITLHQVSTCALIITTIIHIMTISSISTITTIAITTSITIITASR